MSESIVGVRIELRYIRPKIWRRVEVPVYISLATLHQIIQTAFNWYNSHLAEFMVDERSIQVPTLFEFYEEDDYYDSRADEWSLSDVINLGIKRFSYIYDYGDFWDHDVILGKERVAKSAMDCPKLLGGACAAPYEDSGGPYIWDEYVRMLQDPNYQSEDIEEDDETLSSMIEFDFDPESFDAEDMQSRLSGIELLGRTKPARRR